ncbi:hypothetical protein [Bradyrhizobium sp. ORS 86]|uniref:hypothetical protein n=1 Tax=Bradyrhizobium sp. ORS 86 TaxID=1685970 RepID=UPI003890037E
MTTTIHAVATRPVHIPTSLTPTALLNTLGRLGLIVPSRLSATAAAGQSLRACG